MTKKQKKWMEAKIKGDCHMTGQYFDPKNTKHTCFIGALIAPRYRKRVLKRYNAKSVYNLPKDIQRQLMRDTGLGMSQLSDMQIANDRNPWIKARRMALRSWLSIFQILK